MEQSLQTHWTCFQTADAEDIDPHLVAQQYSGILLAKEFEASIEVE
jgi:hypothetical protein